MPPSWHPDRDLKRIEIKCRWLDRFLLTLATGAIVIAVAMLAFRGCNAHGQEAPTMLIPEVLYDVPTNQVERTLLKRPAQQMVPPLPPVISRTVATNVTPDGRWRRVTVTEHEIMPPPLPPLPQSRYMTNVFEVACTRCKVVGLRVPKRVEEVGYITVPGGDELDLTLYFVCCSKEFRASTKVFVETPIAKLIR